MKLKNLREYQLGDVVKFNQELNPVLWEKNETLRPEVRDTLLQIAEDFQEFLGVNGYELDDITISGSNAAYTYTENSDIDLHLVADMSKSKKSEIYRELFDAKKYQYNDLHDYRIGPHEVEVYVQDADQEHISQGIYSILNNDWVSVPTRRQIEIDDMSVSSKFEDVKNRIKTAIDSDDLEHMNRLAKKIGEMRKSGLSKTGEFGPENLAFKILRNTGWLEQLKLARNDAKDAKLSIQEEDNKKHVEEHINDFINFCINWLSLDNFPQINTVHNINWSIDNKTFGQYNSRDDLITVNIGGRHPVDAMRTIAHELVHYAQNRENPLPPEAGKTGSRWENDANSTAGQIMRDYVDVNPAAFANNLNEASGYIAKNSKEAKDPRYSHGLTVDIKPGEIQRQAAKLGLTTDSAGVPPLLGKKKNKRKSNLKENLRVDVPSDEWLNKKIRKAKEEGRDDFGVPYTGTITAYFPDTVKLPVDLLKKLPGMRGEQKNVRREDLEKIMQVMKDTGKLPLTPSGKEYAPFIQVAWNGEAWVNEGNHRIMAADALGWKYLPVELRYYDGGERIESGVLYPQKLGLNENLADGVR
jgi:hypothetical protein